MQITYESILTVHDDEIQVKLTRDAEDFEFVNYKVYKNSELVEVGAVKSPSLTAVGMSFWKKYKGENVSDDYFDFRL